MAVDLFKDMSKHVSVGAVVVFYEFHLWHRLPGFNEEVHELLNLQQRNGIVEPRDEISIYQANQPLLVPSSSLVAVFDSPCVLAPECLLVRTPATALAAVSRTPHAFALERLSNSTHEATA